MSRPRPQYFIDRREEIEFPLDTGEIGPHYKPSPLRLHQKTFWVHDVDVCDDGVAEKCAVLGLREQPQPGLHGWLSDPRACHRRWDRSAGESGETRKLGHGCWA